MKIDNQFVNTFYRNLKNILTREKLKENLKIPIYAYIASFPLGTIVVIVMALLKPELMGNTINPEKLGLSTSPTWAYILTNNIRVLIVLFISGVVLYIGPILGIGLNGFVHGLLLGAFIQGGGAVGLAKYLILMVPHSIFEVPALLFSAGAGIILSKELLSLITVKWISKSRLCEAFLLLFMAFCLFLIASVIEIQVTFRIFKILQQ